MPRVYTSAKHRILDAAERLILRDGPHAVSVDAVLREAQVSKGGFFHHFATKEALLGALMDRLTAAVELRLAASMQADREQRGRYLRAQIALAFDMPALERERTRALILALLAAVMDEPSVAAHARAANEESIAQAIQDGVDVGVALVVQLALDGYFLGESFGTLKLDVVRRRALRDRLMTLVQSTPKKRGRAK